MSAGTPGSRPGQAPAGVAGDCTSWEALATAIALLTRLELCRDTPRAAVLGDQPPDRVLRAMEVVAAALLGVLSPDDGGERVLEALGLLAAERAAQDAAGGSR